MEWTAGRQKNEFEWNLLKGLRTDVMMMRYTYLEVRIHYLEVRISQLARLCSILVHYTIVHYLIVVRHNLGKID